MPPREQRVLARTERIEAGARGVLKPPNDAFFSALLISRGAGPHELGIFNSGANLVGFGGGWLRPRVAARNGSARRSLILCLAFSRRRLAPLVRRRARLAGAAAVHSRGSEAPTIDFAVSHLSAAVVGFIVQRSAPAGRRNPAQGSGAFLLPLIASLLVGIVVRVPILFTSAAPRLRGTGVIATPGRLARRRAAAEAEGAV